jgi:hypothetical protein
MTKMFGLSTGVTTAPVATTGKTTKNTIRAPLEPPKKQSRLTNYFQNKELLNKIKSSPTSSKSGSSDEESIKSETTTVTSESSVRKRKTKIIKG